MNWTLFPLTGTEKFTEGLTYYMQEIYDKLDEMRLIANDYMGTFGSPIWKGIMLQHMDDAMTLHRLGNYNPADPGSCIGKFRAALDKLLEFVYLPIGKDSFEIILNGFAWESNDSLSDLGYPLRRGAGMRCDMKGVLNDLYYRINWVADNMHVWVGTDTVSIPANWVPSGDRDGPFSIDAIYEESVTWLETLQHATIAMRQYFDAPEPTVASAHPAFPGVFVGFRTYYYDCNWEVGKSCIGNMTKVRNADGTKVYRCTSTHTATADTEPGVGANWEDYWYLFYWYKWKPDWADATLHELQDLLDHDGGRYRCIETHTSGGDSEWIPGKVDYTAGDRVSYNGNAYGARYTLQIYDTAPDVTPIDWYLDNDEPGVGNNWEDFWNVAEQYVGTLFEYSWPPIYWGVPWHEETVTFKYQIGSQYGYNVDGWDPKLRSSDSIHIFYYGGIGRTFPDFVACGGMLKVPVYVNNVKRGDINSEENHNIRDISKDITSGFTSSGEHIVQVMPKFSEMKDAFYLPPESSETDLDVWELRSSYVATEPESTVVKVFGDSVGYECIKDHVAGGFPEWDNRIIYTTGDRVAVDHTEGIGPVREWHCYKSKYNIISRPNVNPRDNTLEWYLDDDEPGVGNNSRFYWKDISTYDWKLDWAYFWALPVKMRLLVHPIFE